MISKLDDLIKEKRGVLNFPGFLSLVTLCSDPRYTTVLLDMRTELELGLAEYRDGKPSGDLSVDQRTWTGWKGLVYFLNLLSEKEPSVGVFRDKALCHLCGLEGLSLDESGKPVDSIQRTRTVIIKVTVGRTTVFEEETFV